MDKIDRKFTQLDIDRQILRVLNKKARSLKGPLSKGIAPFLREWQEYVFEKESDAQKLKFTEEGRLDPGYLFLHLKLEAVIRITKARLGARCLQEFKKLYEEGAMKRILEDTSGKR